MSALEQHVHDELIQLILTSPGERLFLPEFGGGVQRLVFENADKTTEGLVKATLTQAISTWLGHRIALKELTVKVEASTIEVEIQYQITGTEETQVMTFVHQAEAV